MDGTSSGSGTAASYSIRGYPTIMRFEKGRASPYQGERTLQHLQAFAVDPELSRGGRESDPGGSFLNTISAWLFPRTMIKTVEGMLMNNMWLIPLLFLCAMLGLGFLGWLLGIHWKELRANHIYLKFTGEDEPTYFGLLSQDPDWEIKTGRQLGRDFHEHEQRYYVHKSDRKRQYRLPWVMDLQIPPEPLPKKED